MIKLYVLYAGDIICKDVSQLNEGSLQSGEMALANPIFLIQHPKGSVMWDAGLSDNLINQKEGMDAWIFHLTMSKTVISQLESIGVHPSDVDYFAFSHIHNDHTGNANYFKSAKLIMQEKEYDIAFSPNKRPFNYDDYKELENSEVIKLNGDYDLFGDGTVQFIATPGHTEGHQSLLLKLENTGALLISGDIAYYKENYQNKGIPTFNASKKDSLASIEKIKKMVANNNAQLWIQHDKENFETLKICPNYYD
ncbi:N-acyl homoserine lactonase family protein [Flammeovirga sp. EKP202]|uniref:N-acyl homoserine lactonase family protein n=1 Tax=Flammeovirga sp. EKP202 TaxID=2770592 RepID=UPI00165EF383|nr:N-acyl homoserine lactonase family protein [Flammeovirga sp. EKP202]MBD0404926.1 N-acyl homoserine lactonase family protein [Flammeovirga sp. EKP202]